MTCNKCGSTIPDDSIYCCYCGKKQTSSRKKHVKTRGNGTGSAYYDYKRRYWIAKVVIGYKEPDDPTKSMIPIKKTKHGFKRKEDALAYCKILKNEKPTIKNKTLIQVYDEWEPWYSPRVDPDTFGCYRAAFKHFLPLHDSIIRNISAGDLQKCMDDCPRGHRTHQNMKVTAGLLWAYAYDRNLVDKNVTKNLFIGRGSSVQREPLTDQEVKTIFQAIGKERYAEYIYCMCYLGFRPGEFLSLKKDHYRVIDGIEVLVNGSKTDAGKDRVVIIPPQILDIVRSRLFVPGTDMIFPKYEFKQPRNQHDKTKLQNGEFPVTFLGFKPMSDAYFRESIFKPMMKRLGIAEGKVPYATRHTYSDKLKRAEGDDKAKAGLMGHTDYSFTRSHYQSTDLNDLLEIAVSME